ncbi:hypothetical protein VTH06DRAFT_6237 [Thermothelomyces fergusii]
MIDPKPTLQNCLPSGEFHRAADCDDLLGKLVLELHNYETGATSCGALRGNLDRNGFEALLLPPSGAAANVVPVLMAKLGFQMDDRTWRDVYASCLARCLPERKAGWTIWVLAGSYYIRPGAQDYDEGWRLLNHGWSDGRSPGVRGWGR